jgi:hypothetical protein
MRFLVQPNPQIVDRARPPVRAFLAFAALLLVGWVASRAAHGALTTDGLLRLLEPSPGERLGPVALWEEVHQGAFLYGFLLLTLGSLLVVCPVSPALRNGLVVGATVAALVDLLAPFLSLAWPTSTGWAVLRIAGFGAAMVLLLATIAVVWGTFGREPRLARG